jgi:hypothetical protein
MENLLHHPDRCPYFQFEIWNMENFESMREIEVREMGSHDSLGVF